MSRACVGTEVRWSFRAHATGSVHERRTRCRAPTVLARHDHRRQVRRLPDHLPLLRGRPGHRRAGPTPGLRLARLLPVRPLAARLGDRPGVHLRQPRRGRDHGHVGERRPVRPPDRPLLLGRRDPGDAVPRRRDDAVLLRLEGPLGPGVHAPPVRHRRPPGQRDLVRGRAAADRRHQPLPARQHRPRAARLAAVGRADRRRGDRALLHHPRRPERRDLQRGAAVLRDRRRRCCRSP